MARATPKNNKDKKDKALKNNKDKKDKTLKKNKDKKSILAPVVESVKTPEPVVTPVEPATPVVIPEVEPEATPVEPLVIPEVVVTPVEPVLIPEVVAEPEATPVEPTATATPVEHEALAYSYSELSELWATSETEGLIKLSNLVKSEDTLIVPENSTDKWEYYFNANANFSLISSELSSTGYHKIKYKKK